MLYWRDTNFRGLSELIGLLAGEADLAEYVDYLRLRERGLRKDAFTHLHRFITAARNWTFARRRDQVDRLMLLQDERPGVLDMIPTPLNRELVIPTLDEWAERDPTSPVPLRWRGGVEDLRRAVLLDPNERIARRKLAQRLLYEVGHAIHHLPWYYIGSALEDKAKLDEVESLLAGVLADESNTLGQRLKSLREEVQTYLTFIGSGSSMTYRDWVAIRQK